MNPDVKRALEAAQEAACEERNHPDWPCRGVDFDGAMSRAAILAFLRTMPTMTRHKVSTGDGGHVYAPSGWNLHELADEVEKEG